MKTSKEIIAIAFSDLHLNMWAKFNKDNGRTLDSIKVLRLIKTVCVDLQVPALFCGDFLHKPEVLDQELGQLIMKYLNELHCRVIAISGNHDLNEVNSFDKPKKSWLHFFGRVFHWLDVIDFKATQLDEERKIMVYGVPYIDHNIDLCKYLKKIEFKKGYKNILLLHTDYPGAKDTDGRVIDSAENLNLNVLNRFDLVLCGHIHKPQRLGKKVYMIGAPVQQRRTDKNCEMGYWEVYSDLSMNFVPLKGFPKFIDVETEEEIKDDGNYYTVVPKSSRVEVSTKHKITKQLSKKKLAKRYLKEKGIKDKVKENLLIKVLKESESC